MMFKEKNSVTYLLRSSYSTEQKRSSAVTIGKILAHSSSVDLKPGVILTPGEHAKVAEHLARRQARAQASSLELQPGMLAHLERNVKDQAGILTAPVLTELTEEARSLTTTLRELRDQLAGDWKEEEKEKGKEVSTPTTPTQPDNIVKPVTPEAPAQVPEPAHPQPAVLPIPPLPETPTPPPVAARVRFFWGVMAQAFRFLFRGRS